jgi:hypothetical protein
VKQYHTTVATVLVVGCLAAAIGLAGAVPDARLTVSQTTVTPTAPDTGETVTVEATIQNSAGSDSGVTLDRISLVDEQSNRTYDAAEDVGALSVGDGVTVPLATSFDETGIYDLLIVVETTDGDGDTVQISHPVRIIVGGVTAEATEDDVEVSVREARPADLESDEDQEQPSFDTSALGGAVSGVPVGGIGQGSEESSDQGSVENMLLVEVANFGTATARDVVVDPGGNTTPLPRRPVDDVPPGTIKTALVDAGRLDQSAQLDITARYSLGNDRLSSTATYAHRLTRAELTTTDVDMITEDGQLVITGNVANTGAGPAGGAVIEVVGTETLRPTYPQRSYFVGSVPKSDFVGFELTVSVDDSDATERVPLSITYLDDGVERQRTVELAYQPRNTGGGGGGTPLVQIALVMSALAIGGGAALIWRRRDDWQ